MSVGSLARDVRRPVARAGDKRARVLEDPVIAAVVALTVLAAILRFYRLGHQGFWFDEANTAADVHLSPGAMLGLLPQNETTPPLFYCIAWVWARVFGFGEVGLRSLAALAGVATVPLAYALGAKLISRRAGVIAAALTACNPFLIWYSQEFRPYELLVLLSGASLLAFLYAKEDPTPRRLAAWVILAGLALAAHYYALLVVVPEALWLIAVHRRRRSVMLAFGLVALCGLALLPLAISQNHTGNASWIAPIPLGPRLDQIFPQFLIGFQAPAQEVLERLADAVVIIALVLLVVRSDPRERRGALTAGAFAASGLAINLVLVAVGIDDLLSRNVLALWLPAALLVAGGLGSSQRPARHPASPERAALESSGARAGLVGILATVVLCAIGVVATVGVALDRNFQRPDWRAVASLLGSRAAPGVGARMILVQHYRDVLPLSLYVHGLRSDRGAGAVRVSEFDVVSIRAPRVRLCWWGAACNLTGSTMQRTYAIPGFHVLWRRRALQFTIMRLVSTTPVLITRRTVLSALTTTTLRRDELLVQR